MSHPEREQNRLMGYDTSQNGAYFITVCVQDRAEILWKSVGANCVRPDQPVPLSDIGEMIDREINKIKFVYESVAVDKYCIMPNHIHMILLISYVQNGRTQFAPTISRVIKQWKGAITKQAGTSIWQKSFHDHIIRNEREYEKIWNYIDGNPLCWEKDCFYPGNGKMPVTNIENAGK